MRKIIRVVASLTLACLTCVLFFPVVYAAGSPQITLTVTQNFKINGSQAPPGEMFTYRFTPKTADAPMPGGSGPEGYDFSMSGTEETLIGPIGFGLTGTYRYELSCVSDATAGYTTDRQIYTIVIYITSNMPPITIVYVEDGDKAGEIVFDHKYTAKSSPPRPEGPNTAAPIIPVIPVDPEKPTTGGGRTGGADAESDLTSLFDPKEPGSGVDAESDLTSPFDPDEPKTGDDSNPAPLIALFTIAGILLFLVIFSGGKSRFFSDAPLEKQRPGQRDAKPARQ